MIGLVTLHIQILIPAVLIVAISLAFSRMLKHLFQFVRTVRSTSTCHREEVVNGIISTMELKDDYTRGHSDRVALYADILARHIRLFTEKELETFYHACLLHDVGKVKIPDHILGKASSLSKEEYEVIKSHPVVGAEAIRGLSGLADCIPVVLHHHERWDGLGYPERLAGESIPILARVAAVADAFDAMTTNRAYRQALSPVEAYRRILKGKGTQFDPRLVDAFQDIFPRWAELCDGYHAKEVLPLASLNYRTLDR